MAACWITLNMVIIKQLRPMNSSILETIYSVVWTSESLKRPSIIELKSLLHPLQRDSACDEKWWEETDSIDPVFQVWCDCLGAAGIPGSSFASESFLKDSFNQLCWQVTYGIWFGYSSTKVCSRKYKLNSQVLYVEMCLNVALLFRIYSYSIFVWCFIWANFNHRLPRFITCIHNTESTVQRLITCVWGFGLSLKAPVWVFGSHLYTQPHPSRSVSVSA